MADQGLVSGHAYSIIKTVKTEGEYVFLSNM